MIKKSRFKLFFEKHPDWKVALVPLGIIGFHGLIMLITGIIFYHTEREIASWPSITGTIVVSRVTHYTDDDGDDYYRPYYSYIYNVDGQEFKNDDFSVFHSTESFSLKEAAIENKLKKGTKVTVFYNPNNPSNAFMHRVEYISAGTIILLILGVILIGIGLIISCIMIFKQ